MILIIDCGSSKTPFIESCVDEFEDVEIVDMYDFDYSYTKHCEGIIISGAPILLTEKDPAPYLALFSWLKETDKPVLGICFGHQILGLTFGALASRIREDRDWQTIEVIADCPLFDKLPSEIELMEDHCEAISIPANFIHAAVSDACVNEAMMHQSKQLFGIQFHPEVSGNHGRIIIENFVHICQQTAENTSE
jgi:GMP synthase (glutamine-hydrolysing)